MGRELTRCVGRIHALLGRKPPDLSDTDTSNGSFSLALCPLRIVYDIGK